MNEIRRDLIISSYNRKKTDQKYEKKIPSVQVRLSQEIKDKIPEPRSTWIRDLIIKELDSNSRGVSRGDNHDSKYQEYLVFFFNFFQNNASNLEISEKEREKIKIIYEVLKSE